MFKHPLTLQQTCDTWEWIICFNSAIFSWGRAILAYEPVVTLEDIKNWTYRILSKSDSNRACTKNEWMEWYRMHEIHDLGVRLLC